MFTLSDEFIDDYRHREVPWGFQIGGGNTLGELVFLRTYSRKLDDGTKERWHEVVRRVVEGCYTIQKRHCLSNALPWDEAKAQRSAQEMYERIFTFKFTPPGRGLWMMGTEWLMEQNNSAPLQNCAFVSTGEGIIKPMRFLMEASMLGVGVGFDVEGAGMQVLGPHHETTEPFVVPDTREGWVEALSILLDAYVNAKPMPASWDFSEVRAAGEPIKGFGGTAAGPGPLKEMLADIENVLEGARKRGKMSALDIMDIANLIGRCVVAGNVRRSAEIALGPATDEFLDAKNWEVNPERNDMETGWGWASNNSVVIRNGDDPDYAAIADRIAANGEPGLVWLDAARAYGRMADPADDRDYRALGTNPCGEQTLESYECCNLVETYPANHDNLDDYLRTLKFAYLYAKTVTLMPTHWPETNAIMQRNRRIGTSMTGVAQFIEQRGADELARWQDEGYAAVKGWDHLYSEWLCVRDSIKVTSVKPSGTVSLLAGATPGVHWPTGDSYIRRVRMAATDPLVDALRAAGYHVEPAVNDITTAVVELPVASTGVPTEREVSVWRKAAVAAAAQRWWADNSVSVTLSFRPDEADDIAPLLATYEGQFKAVSFLPMGDGEAAFPQMPYEEAQPAEIASLQGGVTEVNWDALYDGTALDAIGERYCDSDACVLPGMEGA